MSTVPEKSYGVLNQTANATHVDEVVEQVTQLGYAVLDAGLSPREVTAVADEFARIHATYLQKYGEAALRAVNEHNTIRGMVTHGSDIILSLAMNANLMAVLQRLIPGKFILNQQNGIINPPQEGYNQGSWHRDIPYQHYVSSRPLAINALYCVDDFTLANGATYVLPATHLKEPYPSRQFIERHAVQAEAKAGSFIVLDCMIYHAGGYNSTTKARRAINHVYNIPFFKQQINIPNSMPDVPLSPEAKELLGYTYAEPRSVDDYLKSRISKA
ncbi:MAG: phytanoyl-CoA dioxygenase family protein [Roseiflexaceae bacterium]|jgi:ectoine hydroxylase-related dioxygenase (phytanoyl-CoA dioxygenase family)